MKVSEKENYPGAGKLDLDNSFIPALQHFLYVANGVYATTLDAAGNVIAELDTQTEEEREFLRRVVPPERMKEVAMSIENNFVEEIISVRTDSEYVVSEAVILRLDGMPKGVMIITGVINAPLWCVILNPVVCQLLGFAFRATKLKIFIDAPSCCAASLGLAMYGVLALIAL